MIYEVIADVLCRSRRRHLSTMSPAARSSSSSSTPSSTSAPSDPLRGEDDSDAFSSDRHGHLKQSTSPSTSSSSLFKLNSKMDLFSRDDAPVIRPPAQEPWWVTKDAKAEYKPPTARLVGRTRSSDSYGGQAGCEKVPLYPRSMRQKFTSGALLALGGAAVFGLLVLVKGGTGGKTKGGDHKDSKR